LFSIALPHCTNDKTRPWLRTNRGFGLFAVRRWCVGNKDLALAAAVAAGSGTYYPLAQCPNHPYLAVNGDVDA
jgi:hypothetical protein